MTENFEFGNQFGGNPQQQPQPIKESYEETPQQMDMAPQIESYDPADDDIPYIPGMGTPKTNKPPQFVDLSNPASYSNIQPNGAPQNESVAPVPEYKKGLTVDKVRNMMDTMSDLTADTDSDGSNVQKYAFGVAIKSLYDAIKMLKEVDYWIPEGKQGYTESLKKIATPIVQALDAYVKKIEMLG